MTAIMEYPPLQLTGPIQQQLVKAFERVRDPRDWKAPIQAVIPAADRRVVQKAVILFTGTWPVFTLVPGEADQLVVTAPGYRLGPAEE